MTCPRILSGRGRRRTTAALAALTACLLLPAAASAQLELRFSQNPDSLRGDGFINLRLRPGVTQELFLFVDSSSAKDLPVRVELLSAGRVVATKSLTVKKNERTRVEFGKTVPKDGKPLPLTEMALPLSVRLVDKAGTPVLTPLGEPVEVPIGVARPKEFLKVERKNFDAEAGNVLELFVIVRDDKTFIGPPARVDLVLSPDRIPALVPDQPKKGSYGGWVRKGPDGGLVLRAEGLQFLKDVKTKGGLIYLNVDGYVRGITLFSSFSEVQNEAEPRELDLPLVRLGHPKFVLPGSRLPVVVEVDNRPRNSWLALGMYRKPPEPAPGQMRSGLQTKLLTFPDERLRSQDMDRDVRVFLNPAGPGGGILFEPKVQDWAFAIDTKGLFGERYLGVRTLIGGDQTAEGVKVLDSKAVPYQGLPTGQPNGEGVLLIAEPVLLREGRPDDLTLDVDLPTPKPGDLHKLEVGAAIPLKVTSKDPTGIVKAVFFAGQPLPDGKIPPTAVQAEGRQLPATPDVWVADLAVPTGKRAILPVSVQVTNGVDQKIIKTIQIQLIDPRAAAASNGAKGPKTATLTGKVVEGSRPVPGVAVSLLSGEKGELKGVTKTNAAGQYVLEKVPPGAYVVSAARSVSRTRGQTAVAVPEGVAKVENVDIKLTR